MSREPSTSPCRVCGILRVTHTDTPPLCRDCKRDPFYRAMVEEGVKVMPDDQ